MNSRSRWRSPSPRIPIARSNSSAVSIWNSESRVYDSRISSSALRSWLAGGNPACSSTPSILPRRSGIDRGLAL